MVDASLIRAVTMSSGGYTLNTTSSVANTKQLVKVAFELFSQQGIEVCPSRATYFQKCPNEGLILRYN